jgi:hypothetical protein
VFERGVVDDEVELPPGEALGDLGGVDDGELNLKFERRALRLRLSTSIAVTTAPCSAMATVDEPVPQPISKTRAPFIGRARSSHGTTQCRANASRPA